MAASASNSQLSTLSSVSASGSSARVKLPKLELGKFGGNAMEWQHFFDVFKSLIHSNSGLTDTDKFTYLRSSVYGAAAAVISGLSLTEANYAAAVKCLEQRYGDPQRIISAHMDALLNLPGISNEHDLSGLRKLLEHIPDILLRFRCYPVALTGDIEKAFLMLNVCEHDRNALRFLWWDRTFSNERHVQVYRFARVMFGLTSSPFLLNATLKHLEQYSS